jgi:TldD protein
MHEATHRVAAVPTLLTLLFLGACAAGPAGAGLRAGDEDSRLPILEAMATELARSQARLAIGDHEPPYFLAYQLRDTDRIDIQARYGALYKDEVDRGRLTHVELRVGSYEMDNSGAARQGLFGRSNQATYISRKDGPIDDDLDALRASFWLTTDEKYKEALSDYLRMRGEGVYKPDEDRAPAFSREEPVTHVQDPMAFVVDADTWREEMRRASRRFREAPEIFDNLVRMSARKETRYLATSEGTRLVTEDVLFSIHVSAVARAEDGMLLTHGRSYYGRTESDLPSGAALDAEVDRVMAEVLALRTAPVIDPFTGPALLSPEATGVLFHEAVGHRLEGERQDDEDGGRTFKGQVGRRIIPPFISIYDDPNLEEWGGVRLNGTYAYDDEGVRGQRANLVEAGVLEGYLLSRTPVKGVDARSNGHGRAQGNRSPIARMANLVVTHADEVEEGRVLDMAALEEALLEEARRQGSEYALIIEDITGGDTNVSSWGYQAFRGVPTIVHRIHVETGERELVRGVEIVGTPLTVVNRIAAVSREKGVFNGFCGAESGYVPVSTVAPAALITEVELQRQRRDAERAPVLPPPWVADEAETASAE